jgi:hypothetical protein
MSDPISVVLLPFLKTTEPLTLGGVQFRSTRDLAGAPAEVCRVVTELRQMLFARDDKRIRAATYAVVPYVDLDRAPHYTRNLENIQATIAYLYAAPHEIFGNPFLHTEHASFVLFSQASVPVSLLRRDYNVEEVSEQPAEADPKHHVDGYSGLYNFRHHFWVAPGSRVYGPTPYPVLNISQNLSEDVRRASETAPYRTLIRLLDRPHTPVAVRVHTALRWHNSAHKEATDDYAALVHLAIAFEALLGLPQSEKTERLEDSIALLLGRIPRLSDWARQFYAARSNIVHEGHAPSLHFVTSGESRKGDRQVYQSLFSYGTTVFRLCLGTLLVGADLAEEAGLEERFVTNQERFIKLCKLFADGALTSDAKLERSLELVDAIERFQFVGESGLRLESMFAAIRLATTALIPPAVELDDTIRKKLDVFLNAAKESDHFAELEALREVSDALPTNVRANGEATGTVFRLIQSVWSLVVIHYIRLSRRKKEKSGLATT